MKPKVSVVCTVYKHEKYLKECFDGFVMQKTTFPFEVLVNDDCSPDGSADIMREYEKKYPDMFRCTYQNENQYSKGLLPWFNVLFPLAKGEYIAICEGDDYWIDSYKLQKQVDFMDTHNEYVACFHNALIRYPTGFSFYNTANEISNPTVEDIIKRRWFISTQTLFFRNINLNAPEWSNNVVNEDYLLELLLAKEGNFYYMPYVMAVYRQDGTGVSASLNTNKVKMFEHLIYLLKNMKELYNGRCAESFDESISNYQKQKDEIERDIKKPYLKYFNWRYYKRLILKKMRLVRY